MKNVIMGSKITMVAMWLGMTTSPWKDHLPSVHPVSCIVFMFIDERKQLGKYNCNLHNGSEQAPSSTRSTHHLHNEMGKYGCNSPRGLA